MSTQVPWEFRGKSDVWQFIAEDISAVGSEMYPWDEKVVKAIRGFEPDFCPLWVRSVYKAPSGGFRVFGRHAIGIDCKTHMQESMHAPMKVWGSAYGINAGRRPILVEALIQNPKVRIIPELSVYGYAPLDWNFYYKAKEGWYLTKRLEADADKAANAFIAQKAQAEAQAKKALDEEADYKFDDVTNKGQRIKDEIQSLTHDDWRRIQRGAA